MNPESPMYLARRMTPEQRKAALEHRQLHRLPWHSPPHYVADNALYMITAACYNHQPVIGTSPQRMAQFEAELLGVTQSQSEQIFAWNVLPNHYHVLLLARDVLGLLGALGRLHGRTSHRWNGEEDRRGRQVWHGAETGMKSERHFWATLNYVLHNAVHHGYVERWQDWPYSNAAQYLTDVGREEVERRWREYPILDFGKNWDPPEL
jgi:putative transposase